MINCLGSQIYDLAQNFVHNGRLVYGHQSQDINKVQKKYEYNIIECSYYIMFFSNLKFLCLWVADVYSRDLGDILPQLHPHIIS